MMKYDDYNINMQEIQMGMQNKQQKINKLDFQFGRDGRCYSFRFLEQSDSGVSSNIGCL